MSTKLNIPTECITPKQNTDITIKERLVMIIDGCVFAVVYGTSMVLAGGRMSIGDFKELPGSASIRELREEYGIIITHPYDIYFWQKVEQKKCPELVFVINIKFQQLEFGPVTTKWEPSNFTLIPINEYGSSRVAELGKYICDNIKTKNSQCFKYMVYDPPNIIYSNFDEKMANRSIYEDISGIHINLESKQSNINDIGELDTLRYANNKIVGYDDTRWIYKDSSCKISYIPYTPKLNFGKKYTDYKNILIKLSANMRYYDIINNDIEHLASTSDEIISAEHLKNIFLFSQQDQLNQNGGRNTDNYYYQKYIKYTHKYIKLIKLINN